MAAIIEVKGLSKRFDDIDAVCGLSFTVNEGDIYGFLGQNGAGKSTTIRMLLTLVKPSAGEIKIFGRELQSNRHDILRQTGAIIERPDMYKYLSAYDNLSIFARISGVKPSRKYIMERLEQVGLAQRFNSKVKTFSQGMKQRLGIAIALVHDPKLVILDEPANGLDPQGIADMRNLILSLSRNMGKTVLVSSHLLNEIEQVANRMIIINKGKKVVEGEVATLLDPSKTHVMLETTDNAAAYAKMQAAGIAGNAELHTGHIMLTMNRSEVPGLAVKLTAMDIGILAINPRHSLEDYFLSLTNTGEDV